MKSLILYPHELTRLADAGSVTIWRPVKPPVWPASHDGKRCGNMLVDLARATTDRGFPTDEDGELLPSSQWATAPASAYRYWYLHVPFAHPSDGWDENGEDARDRHYCDLRPGEQRWVKETIICNDEGDLYYVADGAEVELPENFRGDFRIGTIPSIHMPRWASRYTVTVGSVAVKRVRDATAEDVWTKLFRLPLDSWAWVTEIRKDER